MFRRNIIERWRFRKSSSSSQKAPIEFDELDLRG
jgi:hypothetical protein